MDSIANYITKEKDILYRMGEKKGLVKGIEKGIVKGKKEGLQKGKKEGQIEGEEKKSYEVVKNLLKANKFTLAEIANFANVAESFVKKVKRSFTPPPSSTPALSPKSAAAARSSSQQ